MCMLNGINVIGWKRHIGRYKRGWKVEKWIRRIEKRSRWSSWTTLWPATKNRCVSYIGTQSRIGISGEYRERLKSGGMPVTDEEDLDADI